MTPPRPPGWLAHEAVRRPCLLPGARWWYRRGNWQDRCTPTPGAGRWACTRAAIGRRHQ